MSTFLVAPTKIEGVYGNRDVDALVFRYATHVSEEATLENMLDHQASAAGWTRLPDSNGLTCYERVTPKGERTFFIRVRLNADNNVTVGWVQGDSLNEVAFNEMSEAAWAETEIWPQLIRP